MTTITFDRHPEKATRNAATHGITFGEATEVFRDPLHLSVFDADSSLGEERWATVGAVGNGLLILVIHTWIENEAGTHRLASFLRVDRRARKRSNIARSDEGRI